MNRDAAFWSLVVMLLVIPGLLIGWFRGLAAGRVYRALYMDLKAAGIELSGTELHHLWRHLLRNPKAVLNGSDEPSLRAIKERHVAPLVAYFKSTRLRLWIVWGVGVIALASFVKLWPKN